MKENDDLMSGLKILSPEETMNAETPKKGEEEEGATASSTIDNQEEENENSLKIVPPTDNESKKEEDNSEGKQKPSSDSDNKKSNVFAALIKDLAKDGILTTPEEEEKFEELLNNANVDTVKELMEKTLEGKFEKHQQNWKNSLSNEQKRYLDIEDAFSSTDEAIRISQRLEYVTNIDFDALSKDENLQSNLYYEDLVLKGFSREEALEAIQEAKSLGKLEEKATKAIKSIEAHDTNLVEQNKVEAQKARAKLEQENQEAFDNLMTTIDNKESIIDGLSLNKVSREKIKNNMLDSVYEDTKGNKYTSLMYKQMKNPQEFDILINYLDTIGVFNIDKNGNFKPDLSKLKTVAKTKATSELEEVLNRDSGNTGQRNSVRASEKTEGIIDFLERASKNK